MDSVEDFIHKYLGIHPLQLVSWRVTSGATSRGLITNTLTFNFDPDAIFQPSGRLAHPEVVCPTERVGSLIPTAGNDGNLEVLLVRGKETSELFTILSKTMFIEPQERSTRL